MNWGFRDIAAGWRGRSPFWWLVRIVVLFPLLTVVLFHIWFVTMVGLSCHYLKVAQPPFTAFMAYRMMQGIGLAKYPEFIPYDRIPPAAARMFVVLEDGKFWTHPGFDIEAIKRAAAINRAYRRTIQGGSTITQQLARNLFLSPQKSIERKYLELIAAVEMELILPKKRILELYINSIEYGKGVYGLGAAARYYFRKPASLMMLEEYRRLVAILPSPLRYTPSTFWNHAGLAARYRVLAGAPPPAQDAGAGNGDPPVDPAATVEGSQAQGDPSGTGTQVGPAAFPESVDPGGGAEVPAVPSSDAGISAEEDNSQTETPNSDATLR